MRRSVLILFISFAASFTATGSDSDILVMFWNVENLFDWENGDTGTSEAEFSPEGERRWTKSRFWTKIHGIAKTILWTRDSYGRLPDVIGLAEVENSRVVGLLSRATLLKKFGYRAIHFDSPDPRGIDVALLYRETTISKISATPYRVKEDCYRNCISTRDILLVTMSTPDGRKWEFLVNHHPSKYSGARASMAKREAAMKMLSHICDSLSGAGEKNIIAMGDFNDSPDAETFGHLSRNMRNKATILHEKGEGTIRYEGKWDLIDMFLVDSTLENRTEMEICRPSFLLSKDSRHSGYKPRRTYIGPRYEGGISDHLPIILKIEN